MSSKRCRIGARDEVDRSVFRDGIAKVGQHAIELHRNSALRERRRDGLGDFEARGSRLDLALFAIGERNGDVCHFGPPLLTRRKRTRRKTMSGG